MLIGPSFKRRARSVGANARGLIALSTALLLAACANPDTPAEKPTAAPPAATTTVASEATTAAAPAPAPIVALPYDQAVELAARDVFSKATLPPGQKYTIVIDPLVDGSTGVQSVATVAMEKQLVNMVKSSFPQYEVKTFSAANVATLPLIFVGTFTPINLQGKAEGERDAYRICYALADLKNRQIVSQGLRRRDGRRRRTPHPYFKNSHCGSTPVRRGYIKTCQHQGRRPINRPIMTGGSRHANEEA